MTNIRVLFIVIFLLSLGCIHTDIKISESRHYPKNPNFSIHNDRDYSNSTIDYNAIYYSVFEENDLDRKSYNWHRFWPNGRTLIDYSDKLPSADEAEDFTQAYLGYYKIVGHDELVMEYFVPNTGRWCWDYLLVYAKIENDKIIIYKEEMNGKVNEYLDILYRYNYNPNILTRKPDW